MKMTNKSLVNAINTLDKYGKMKLPQKISYAITKNTIILKREYDIYNTQLIKIFNDYGEYISKDKDGKAKTYDNGLPVIKDKTLKEEMTAALVELLNIEVDIDLFKIDFNQFDYDDKGIYDVLTPQDILNLSTILCDAKE